MGEEKLETKPGKRFMAAEGYMLTAEMETLEHCPVNICGPAETGKNRKWLQILGQLKRKYIMTMQEAVS